MRRFAYLVLALVFGVVGCGDAPTCESVKGAYQLVAEDRYSVYGGAPWILVQAEDEGCGAVVACAGNPGRGYNMTIGDEAIYLYPRGPEARCGGDTPDGYHRTDWKSVTLAATSDGLTGEGKANVSNEYYEEDIWDDWDKTVELSVEEPKPATLSAPSQTLPWSNETVLSSRPVAELSPYLVVPSADWTANDVVLPDAVGVHSSSVRYLGDWDALRGRRVEIGVGPMLTDLAGMPLSRTTLEMDVFDVGPAIAEHDFRDTSTVATWGDVRTTVKGDCETLGCVSFLGACGRMDGVAGQIDSGGSKELVLVMHGEFPPYNYAVQVVAADGTPIPRSNGGDWPREPIQEWVYDIAGERRVGFSLAASGDCHGFSEREMVVDRVFVR